MGLFKPYVRQHGCVNERLSHLDSIRLKNNNGARLTVISLGGAITSLCLPDKHGNVQDIVLGFDQPEQYLDNPNYFGVIVGRCANRIAHGQFTLGTKAYQVAVNQPPHHLHSGPKGFHKQLWAIKQQSDHCVNLHRISPHNEEGYPGNLDVSVSYTLTDANELIIDYKAQTDQPTIINLTQHTYFNLAGHNSGNILDHQIQINADYYTPINADHIPTGSIEPVAETPLDLRELALIGDTLQQNQAHPQIQNGNGFDHNYVCKQMFDAELKYIAKVYEPKIGRQMTVFTDQPGVQFYNGSYIESGTPGKQGASYSQHQGLCLETQHFPDSPNNSKFPSIVLSPEKTYQTRTVYRFENN